MEHHPRVLLIEHVDATGAAALDVSARAIALRSAGANVEVAVLEQGHHADLLYDSCERAPKSIHSRHSGVHALDSLARTIRASGAERVVWAGSAPGGGRTAARALGGRSAIWWPTGFAAVGSVAGPLTAPTTLSAICSAHARDADGPPRRRLSLWDGPFILAFVTPGQSDAAHVLELFAAVASTRDGIDLVVLGQPHPSFESHARRLDVLARVHCVGPAPREAEACWLQTASCTILSSDAAMSGGVLLRAASVGHPMMAHTPAGALHAWLTEEALAWGAHGESIESRLDAALDSRPDVTAAVQRARTLAQRHDADALAREATCLVREQGATRRRAA